LRQQQQKTQQRDDQPSYISVYTRIVTNAPPGSIEQLRKNGVSFSAAVAASSSTTALIVIVTIRSLMMTFYCWSLYRFYRQMTGKGGKGDNPGKLANGTTLHDLPAATFDDIAGIDAVKYEVMKLVDTICNPNS
jgi:ATP-dependent Zn protease